MTHNPIGDIITEQTQRVVLNGVTQWERVLRLHIRPRPWWMLPRLYRYALKTLLVQSERSVRP